MNDSYYKDSKVTLHSTAKKGLSRLHKNFEHNFNIIYYGSLWDFEPLISYSSLHMPSINKQLYIIVK